MGATRGICPARTPVDERGADFLPFARIHVLLMFSSSRHRRTRFVRLSRSPMPGGVCAARFGGYPPRFAIAARGGDPAAPFLPWASARGRGTMRSMVVGVLAVGRRLGSYNRPQNRPQSPENIKSHPRLRRALKPLTSPRRQAGFETPRNASLLSMRAERVRPPPRQATIARKIRRKSLKRLNPRPETPSPHFSGKRVGVRGLGDWPLTALAWPSS